MGRAVREWSLKPNKPDNHWLDCITGCTVAISMCGPKLPGQDPAPAKNRKRYTQADFARR